MLFSFFCIFSCKLLWLVLFTWLHIPDGVRCNKGLREEASAVLFFPGARQGICLFDCGGGGAQTHNLPHSEADGFTTELAKRLEILFVVI